MNEFFAMGGYGAFVWTAYGVTFVALLLLFIWSWSGARRREAELDQVRKLARAVPVVPDSGPAREGPAPEEADGPSDRLGHHRLDAASAAGGAGSE